MKRTIHHSWQPVENSQKLKHYRCIRCHCERWYDSAFKQVVYEVWGKIYLHNPSCIMPNSLICK